MQFKAVRKYFVMPSKNCKVIKFARKLVRKILSATIIQQTYLLYKQELWIHVRIFVFQWFKWKVHSFIRFRFSMINQPKQIKEIEAKKPKKWMSNKFQSTKQTLKDSQLQSGMAHFKLKVHQTTELQKWLITTKGNYWCLNPSVCSCLMH